MFSLRLLPDLLSKSSVGMMIVHQVLKDMEFGSVTLKMENGSSFRFPGKHPGPDAVVYINDWAGLREIVRKGDIGLAEAYISKKLDFESIAEFIQWACLNEKPLKRYIYGHKMALLRYQLRHWLRANNKKQSQQNIEAHYDLGNSFYDLWLDETKSYSSGIYDSKNISLYQAQVNKYQRVLDQIRIQPKQEVLEIGCGWGGFLSHLMKNTEASYTGITLSKQQLHYVHELIQKNSWQDRAKVLLVDYRDVQGEFDHIVSIEMVEAVGVEYWPSYVEALKKHLKPKGTGLIQGICIDEKLFEDYIHGTDFIQQYIFPGGALLSIDRFTAEMKNQGLNTLDIFPMGLSYAKTLNEWTKRVQAAKDQIYKQGFDEKFYRTWLFYLGYCEGAFLAKRTDVVQLLFSH